MLAKRNRQDEHGSVLVGSLVLMVALVMGAAAFLSHTSTEVLQVRKNNASVRAFYYTEAGLNYAQGKVLRGWKLSSYGQPFYFIDNQTMTSLPADMVVRAGTPDEGRFYVEILNTSTPYPDARDVTVKSTGIFREETRSAITTFRLELKPSRAFNYGYFLDHGGWLEGMPSSFQIHGNVRAAGDFSFFGSNLFVNGNPESRDLRGQLAYKDSGGIYSGFGILDALSLNGMGSLAANQYVHEDVNTNGLLDAGEDHNGDGRLTRPEHIAMPNLSEMGDYEESAQTWSGGAGSSIKIQGAGAGGTDLLVSNAVFGDEDGETGNLMLWGTEQNPIVIDGPVVVRGALIIKGYVTGKGSLYAGHNIYVPDNLMYVNPPLGRPDWDYSNYSTPEERYTAWTQAVSQWRQANADKDGLGLIAKENVVIGDFQEASWRTTVEAWLDHPANESAEAANGLDSLPNTNDAGENDGTWTAGLYTQEDLADGFIPSGKSVGDVIPGSGEDMDADAMQDGRIALSDFDLPAPIDITNWGGWTPLGQDSDGDKDKGKGKDKDKGKGKDDGTSGGPTSYADFFNEMGGDALDHIDALICAGHATAGNWGRNSPAIHLLGGIVSRIEALIFRNDGSAEWTHDERFTGGGEDLGFVLPEVKRPIQILHWAEVPSNYTYSGT